MRTAARTFFPVSILVGVLLAGSTAAQGLVTIETVTVGDPDNAKDTHGLGYGAVGYTYQIGKYEVTNAQYAEFLNAVATVGDPYKLYEYDMGGGWNDIGGISRSGAGTEASPRVYTVRPGRGNMPANYISFWDACRFVNWLNHGQPVGRQDATTTEDGAYAVNGYNWTEGQDISRKPGTRWCLPTVDEWYKAAYYKGGSPNAGYWDYATATNALPGNDILTPDPGNNANFYDGAYAVGGPYWTTPVGEFETSDSPYGTFDQTGNLWEWTEQVLVESKQAYRCLRGASFMDSRDFLAASYWPEMYYPCFGQVDYGFRVAVIPEPATLALVGLGGLGMLLRRRARRA
jgi:sulfatase modifying factor 1